MITIRLSNDNAFIWDAEEWMVLREKHRIVGSLIGCLSHLPRQEVMKGLPMILLPEEVTLLLENNIARVVICPSLGGIMSSEIKYKYDSYKEKINEDQKKLAIKIKRDEVLSMMDHIIEGKKKKYGQTQNNEETLIREIKNNELNRAETSVLENFIPLAQLATADPFISEEDLVDANWSYPSTKNELLKYKIFRDLWHKGYYITIGSKFGGDYLVYPGDPVKYHSHFIVICLEEDQNLSAREIVMYGRIGTSTRKTVVLATVSNNEVYYESLQWAGKS